VTCESENTEDERNDGQPRLPGHLRRQDWKPDPRLAVQLHIEPGVKFGKGRDVWKVRQGPSHDTLHAERDEANPRSALKLLDLQRLWNQRAKLHGRNRPVSKKQITP
jgi:hypothetical protein